MLTMLLMVALVPVLHAVAGPGKVTLCHYPPGNPANVQTLDVGSAAHEAFVDLGATEDCKTPTATSTATVTEPTATVKPTEPASTIVAGPTATQMPVTGTPRLVTITIECSGRVTFSVADASSIMTGQTTATITVTNDPNELNGGTVFVGLTNGQEHYSAFFPFFAAETGSLTIEGYIGSQENPAQYGPISCPQV